MTSVKIAIDQRDITITRSVARDVVRSIMRQTSFPETASLLFDEHQGAAKELNGVLTPCTPRIRTETNDYVFITYEETYMEEGRNKDNDIRSNYLNVFNDHELGVYVRPNMVQMVQNLTLRFRTRDLTMLSTFRNILKTITTNGPLMMHHDVFYDYNIPDSVSYFISRIYQLRENKHGYGESFKEYLADKFKNGVGIRKNMSGTHKQPIVEECQTGIVGRSLSSMPFNVMDIGDGLYELTMDHVVYYQHPVTLSLFYPVMVHNQFLGQDLLNAYKDKYSDARKKLGWSPLDYLKDGVTDSTSRYYLGDGGTRLVASDDWYPAEPYRNTQTLCIFPYQVDVNNPHDVCSLMELGDELIPAAVKAHLKLNIGLNGAYPESIITVEVFESYSSEKRLAFEFGSNLEITTAAILNPRYKNYVRVALSKDWTTAPNSVLRQLMYEPETLHSLARILDAEVELIIPNDRVTRVSGRDLVVSNGAVTRESLREWLRRLPWVNKAFKRAPDTFMRTVSTNIVTVK